MLNILKSVKVRNTKSERQSPEGAECFDTTIVEIGESMQEQLGWKEEDVFEELKALSIHLNEEKS